MVVIYVRDRDPGLFMMIDARLIQPVGAVPFALGLADRIAPSAIP
jgi:hypothetical protein